HSGAGNFGTRRGASVLRRDPTLMPTPRRLAVPFVVPFLVLAAASARAQAPAPEAKAQSPASPAQSSPPAAPPRQESRPMAPFAESVEVSVTNVEVVVTDSKGKRVPGLTKEDFQILLDGVPQTITNFYAVTGGKVLLEDGKTVSIEVPSAESPAETA